MKFFAWKGSKLSISKEKLVKILLAVFLIVFSFTVLSCKVPETKFVQESVEYLEESQNTVMKFSGTTIATSLAISALPDDFASPLAGTISDLNTYFIFLFAVIFVEKLIVLEGVKLALKWIIPAACILYVISLFFIKEVFQKFAVKLLILGLSIIMVIPISTHVTESVCADYLDYVEETINETDAGASKINDVMNSGDKDTTFFEKISNAFKTAIQSVSDLLTYFKNVIKKCMNSVAIMIVTTFVVPMLILLLFRWLLKELFSLHLPIPDRVMKVPVKTQKNEKKETEFTGEQENER